MSTGHTPDSSPPAKKRRRHYIAPEMPYPSAPDARTPLWKKLWFWLFLVIALLVAMPALRLAWNILRPDTAAPAPAAWPEYRKAENAGVGASPALAADSPAHAASEIARARVVARLIAALPPEVSGDADILAGRRFDAEATPRFIAAVVESLDKAAAGMPAEIRKASRPPFAPADIEAYDGFLRAGAATARANQRANDLTEISLRRLKLSACLMDCASTTEGFTEALAHERKVLSEIRADAALIVKDTDALKPLLAALARHADAPSPEFAAATARAFDAALDESPDAALRAISAKPSGDTGGFLRLALAARKPNEHRRRVSELLRQFGEALAKPGFAEARRALPAPGETQDIRLATALLRAEVIRRLGGDTALNYFFPELPEPDSALEVFGLKFFALSDVKDPYGEALLLHRRAQLLALIARRDRTRFEAAATAYALGIEYRRAGNSGQRPKDTENLFAGLLELYPLDPFTGEPLLYSRKRLNLHSPGADGVDLGGLSEPEFATELAQLWEPTVPIEPEPPLNPAAFGLKPSDLDKPVIRASEAKPKE